MSEFSVPSNAYDAARRFINAVWESVYTHVRMSIVQWSSHIRKNAAFYIFLYSILAGECSSGGRKAFLGCRSCVTVSLFLHNSEAFATSIWCMIRPFARC